MASVTFTVKNIVSNWDRNAIIMNWEAGEAMTPGDCVFLDSDEKVYLADADTLLDFAARSAIGICVSVARSGVSSIAGVQAAVAGDRVAVCIHGNVNGFSGLTPGNYVYVSTTAGDIEDTAPANQFVLGRVVRSDTIFVSPGTFNAPS